MLVNGARASYTPSVSSATYEQIKKLMEQEPTWSQAQVGVALGVSRQYISQMLAREVPPGASGVKHGTAPCAATCSCSKCADLRRDIHEALPEALALLRAGETLRKASDALGHNIALTVATARKAIERGQPTLFAELVKTFDETASLRPQVGRPRSETRRAA